MVDACSLQQTQRLPDVFCRSFLAGMGDREEAVLACPLEDVDKLRGWMADFVRIESYSGDLLPNGSACSRVSKADSTLKCRKKHMIRREVMP